MWLQQKVKPDSIVYTNTWGSYNALNVSEFKHYRVNHSELFTKKHNDTNRMKNFLNPDQMSFTTIQQRTKASFHLIFESV